MEFTVNRQPELMMDLIWLLIGAAALVVSVIFFVMLFKFGTKKRVRKYRPPKPAKMPGAAFLREKALLSIDKLINDVGRGRIDIREGYQSLSTIMRKFVTDISGNDVTCLTLAELESRGPKKLTDLVDKWYEPEFAMRTRADFIGDARQAQKVVRTWN